MMKYYEDLTPEQRADLAGRRASYESAQRRLKDPVFMARLWAQMAELDARPPAPRLTREEFLAQFATSSRDDASRHRSRPSVDRA